MNKESKIVKVAEYIIDNKATVASCAKHFNCSVSTIKKYINNDGNLKDIDLELYKKVKEVQKEIETLKEEIRKKENELALKRETNNKIAGELKVISDSIANLDKDQEKIEEEIKQNQEAKKTAVEIMQKQLTNLTLFEPQESTVKLNSYITGKEVEKAYDFLTKRLN